MLSELTIRDFAIISELNIKFGQGFNILTGETGAGKSIILDAVMLILGGRADTSFIRAGCERALVEAVVAIDKKIAPQIEPILANYALKDEDEDRVEELLISRELKANGRNVCRINGLPTRATVLRELGEILIGIHGQGEHLALLKAKAHLPLLDAYTGIGDEVRALGKMVRAVKKLQKEQVELRQNREMRQNRIEFLRFKVEEIEAANLEEDEERRLKEERQKLANSDLLSRASQEAIAFLTGVEVGEGDLTSVSDLISQVEGAVSLLAKHDTSQAELLKQVQGVVSDLDDIGSSLRAYAEQVEHDPNRLTEIEERIDFINRLKRKYGDSIEAILKGRDEAAAELDAMENSDERLGKLDSLIEQELRKIGKSAASLSTKRKAAAEKLSRRVEKELADLRMKAKFGVDFKTLPDPDGVYIDEERLAFDRFGIDKVEFMLASNAGEPLKPMEKVASGGETARIMLALKTALAEVDATPTLIFDEIDQGIGGRIGAVVGAKLWSLSGQAGHQVICVTHLPQMAGFGDIHFRVLKGEADGRTSTQVTQLDHQERIDELAEMLGLKDDLAKVNARSLLKEAENKKKSVVA